MNKRILSMLLGAMIVFSLCACGAKTGELRTDSSQVSTQEAADTAEAAETSDAEAPEGRTENYAEMGLKVDYPAEFDNTKGYFLPDILGEVTPGLNFMRFYYIAMTQEKYKELSQKSSLTEEEENDVRNKVGIILDVIAIDKGRGAEDIISEMGADAKFLDQITEIGKAEDVTFYILDESSSMSGFEERVGKEYAQEYTSLHDSLIEVLKKAEFSVPVPSGSEYIGKKISFETTDVDGNPVKSEEIFAQNKITMLNVWATWCGPCKGELRGLGEMNRSYAGKGVAVVGLCADADTNLEECKKLLAENEVDYLNLLPFEGYEGTIPIPRYPVSYFVDSEGTIIAPPMEGAPADMSTYEEYIDELLEEK